MDADSLQASDTSLKRKRQSSFDDDDLSSDPKVQKRVGSNDGDMVASLNDQEQRPLDKSNAQSSKTANVPEMRAASAEKHGNVLQKSNADDPTAGLRAELEKVCSELENAHAELETTKRQLGNANTRIETMKREYDDADYMYQTTKGDLEEMRTDRDSLRNKVSKYETSRDEFVQRFRREEISLNNQLFLKGQDIKSLRSDLTNAEEKRASCNTARIAAETKLEEKNREVEVSRGHISELEHRLQEANARTSDNDKVAQNVRAQADHLHQGWIESTQVEVSEYLATREAWFQGVVQQYEAELRRVVDECNTAHQNYQPKHQSQSPGTTMKRARRLAKRAFRLAAKRAGKVSLAERSMDWEQSPSTPTSFFDSATGTNDAQSSPFTPQAGSAPMGLSPLAQFAPSTTNVQSIGQFWEGDSAMEMDDEEEEEDPWDVKADTSNTAANMFTPAATSSSRAQSPQVSSTQASSSQPSSTTAKSSSKFMGHSLLQSIFASSPQSPASQTPSSQAQSLLASSTQMQPSPAPPTYQASTPGSNPQLPSSQAASQVQPSPGASSQAQSSQLSVSQDTSSSRPRSQAPSLQSSSLPTPSTGTASSSSQPPSTNFSQSNSGSNMRATVEEDDDEDPIRSGNRRVKKGVSHLFCKDCDETGHFAGDDSCPFRDVLDEEDRTTKASIGSAATLPVHKSPRASSQASSSQPLRSQAQPSSSPSSQGSSSQAPPSQAPRSSPLNSSSMGAYSPVMADLDRPSSMQSSQASATQRPSSSKWTSFTDSLPARALTMSTPEAQDSSSTSSKPLNARQPRGRRR